MSKRTSSRAGSRQRSTPSRNATPGPSRSPHDRPQPDSPTQVVLASSRPTSIGVVYIPPQGNTATATTGGAEYLRTQMHPVINGEIDMNASQAQRHEEEDLHLRHLYRMLRSRGDAAERLQGERDVASAELNNTRAQLNNTLAQLAHAENHCIRAQYQITIREDELRRAREQARTERDAAERTATRALKLAQEREAKATAEYKVLKTHMDLAEKEGRLVPSTNLVLQARNTRKTEKQLAVATENERRARAAHAAAEAETARLREALIVREREAKENEERGLKRENHLLQILAQTKKEARRLAEKDREAAVREGELKGKLDEALARVHELRGLARGGAVDNTEHNGDTNIAARSGALDNAPPHVAAGSIARATSPARSSGRGSPRSRRPAGLSVDTGSANEIDPPKRRSSQDAPGTPVLKRERSAEPGAASPFAPPRSTGSVASHTSRGRRSSVALGIDPPPRSPHVVMRRSAAPSPTETYRSVPPSPLSPKLERYSIEPADDSYSLSLRRVEQSTLNPPGVSRSRSTGPSSSLLFGMTPHHRRVRSDGGPSVSETAGLATYAYGGAVAFGTPSASPSGLSAPSSASPADVQAHIQQRGDGSSAFGLPFVHLPPPPPSTPSSVSADLHVPRQQRWQESAFGSPFAPPPSSAPTSAFGSPFAPPPSSVSTSAFGSPAVPPPSSASANLPPQRQRGDGLVSGAPLPSTSTLHPPEQRQQSTWRINHEVSDDSDTPDSPIRIAVMGPSPAPSHREIAEGELSESMPLPQLETPLDAMATLPKREEGD
ncbi:hypothetical protein PLICRDRAFT_699449 [Plicaturopsis crispa FD-325 SS-3]|nr:hypothetical protein PLICRDRAFT_699449 [Plicaturopsis crispa FD-325 SS-3]